jgi:protein-disulfide isomerase
VLCALSIVVSAVIIGRSYLAESPKDTTTDAPANSVLELKDLPTLGSQNARVAVVEFSDFQCPYCRRFNADVFAALKNEFINTGRIRYAFGHHPLQSHPLARFLAVASICAAKQTDFWDIHDAFFRRNFVDEGDVAVFVKERGIKSQEFEQCVDDRKSIDEKIENETALALELGLFGTPSFAIGAVTPDGRLSIKKLVSGAQSLDSFERVIRQVDSMSNRS